MSVPALVASARLFVELRDRLLSDEPDIDDLALADTLEGATDLNERIVGLCRAVRETRVLADGLAGMIGEMAARKKRLEARADRLRALALWAMSAAALDRITAPDVTLTRSAGKPSVHILDVAVLPAHFVRLDPFPDRVAIRAALKRGEDVPGAMLANAGLILTIRTR